MFQLVWLQQLGSLLDKDKLGLIEGLYCVISCHLKAGPNPNPIQPPAALITSVWVLSNLLKIFIWTTFGSDAFYEMKLMALKWLIQ